MGHPDPSFFAFLLPRGLPKIFDEPSKATTPQKHAQARVPHGPKRNGGTALTTALTTAITACMVLVLTSVHYSPKFTLTRVSGRLHTSKLQAQPTGLSQVYEPSLIRSILHRGLP
ncbi:uncharacterized protein K489DRAFT_379422 [Dissoconium aciculare CBS 342.82]|uniref:Uncharacterized protein n=1 Tax=Dissoconium aciculare CBS 342.82 TaxID=1314786 RepID=A0A6J3M698_9PEZI|nr:uncharacterized protein K489DRAFT_379422 [Dissoconium aciculare CBS 342.82]KAF1823423.1 hypothetical protein K489DRAFT_379422 [Dissoconium aciculare CBS 342.82]